MVKNKSFEQICLKIEMISFLKYEWNYESEIIEHLRKIMNKNKVKMDKKLRILQQNDEYNHSFLIGFALWILLNN